MNNIIITTSTLGKYIIHFMSLSISLTPVCMHVCTEMSDFINFIFFINCYFFLYLQL